MTSEIVAGLAALVSEREGPGLIFVDRRAEAQGLAAALEEYLGWEVAWVTAERSQAVRAELAERMRTRELQLAVCTAAWSTGLDIPALRYVILTGENKAPIGALQSVGRALRNAEGKDGFEVLNVGTADTMRQAAARGSLLRDYGFEVRSEEGFLDRLEEAEAARAAGPPPLTNWQVFTIIFGTPDLWVVAGALGLLLHLAGLLSN